MKRFESLRLVGIATLFAAVGLVGCGDDDDGGGTPDGGTTIDSGGTADAKPIDAGGSPDAVAATHAGTIGVHDIRLLDSAAAGRGGQINITFNKTGIPNVASIPGPALPPCGATLTDVTIPAQVPAELNEGTVTIAVKKSGGANGTAIPPCNLVGGDYRCISAMGSGGTLAAGQNSVFTFTDTTATPNTFSAAQVGSYLIETAGSGRAMPITGASGSMLGIQGGTGAAAGAVASWIVAAGIGPVALTSDVTGANPTPGGHDFLGDTDKVTVTLADQASSGDHFAYTTSPEIEVGDDFELDAATMTLLASDLNLSTTTPLRFGCATTGAKACSGTTANGIIVVIDGTDATSFPGGLTDMGTPVKYTSSLTCAFFGTEVSIPADVIGILKMGNPTKLRISVFRDSFSPLQNPTPPRNSINVVAGHGLIKFQEL